MDDKILLFRISEIIEQMQMSIQEKVRLAIRVTIARKLTQQAFRPFSVRLAESRLLQHFCLIDHIDKIQIPSKSTLERYEKMFPENIIREMNTILMKAAISPEIETEENRLKLEESISLDEYFADSTAIKANIHYPVDWVLLRDAYKREGRIGIIKNSFLGNPSKGKSFNSRNLSTAWSVLSHNFWVLARLPEADVRKKEQAA